MDKITQSNEKVAKIVANLNSVETSALKLNLKIANASIKSLLKSLNSYNKPCFEIDYCGENVKKKLIKKLPKNNYFWLICPTKKSPVHKKVAQNTKFSRIRSHCLLCLHTLKVAQNAKFSRIRSHCLLRLHTLKVAQNAKFSRIRSHCLLRLHTLSLLSVSSGQMLPQMNKNGGQDEHDCYCTGILACFKHSCY